MPRAHAAAESLVGTVIGGKYRVVQLLGSGGVGHIYVADRVGGVGGAGGVGEGGAPSRVALKVLRAEHRQSPAVVARFEREAEAAARVRHPNVLRAERLEQGAGVPCFAMELLLGLDLADTLASARVLAPARAVRVAADVAAGLEAAHRAGVIHRDVKPENVFLLHEPDGREPVKLLDFGVSFVRGLDHEPYPRAAAGRAEPYPRAAAGRAEPPRAAAGRAEPPRAAAGRAEPPRAAAARAQPHPLGVGTPEYMAPEQARGAPPAPEADVYALGIVLYETLAGRVPFVGSHLAVIEQHQREPLPPPHRFHPGLLISRDLDAVVRKALVKDPRGRFASMAELRAALLETPEAREESARSTAPGEGSPDTPPRASGAGATVPGLPAGVARPTNGREQWETKR